MSTWREKYKVHPAADVFPMMDDAELLALGEDIKAYGLNTLITVSRDSILLDGRNRLEAMERAGIVLRTWQEHIYGDGDPVAFIIGRNIHRRHLTKQEQADLIVAAVKADPLRQALQQKKPRQVGEVSKGGRGKVDHVKAKAVAAGKEHGISKRTVERSFAKAEGRMPEPKKIAGPKLRTKPKLETHVGIDAARKYYLEQCEDGAVDLDVEQEIIIDGLREIAGKRANIRQALMAAKEHELDVPTFLDRKRASTLPQDGRSEEALDDHTSENGRSRL